MPAVNLATKELTIKLVYYGPGLGGKTSNLKFIHSQLAPESRGELVQLATETERTLYFDFMSLDLGEVENFKIRMSLYTVPGQAVYDYSRRTILRGVDAIVFVADSGATRLEDNAISLANMAENLEVHKLNLKNLPWVMQYNKRDIRDALPIEVLQGALNKDNSVPYFEAIALNGSGVFSTLRAVSKAAIEKIVAEL
jgi:signal recognition particle receptor subunit beta